MAAEALHQTLEVLLRDLAGFLLLFLGGSRFRAPKTEPKETTKKKCLRSRLVSFVSSFLYVPHQQQMHNLRVLQTADRIKMPLRSSRTWPDRVVRDRCFIWLQHVSERCEVPSGTQLQPRNNIVLEDAGPGSR